MPNNISENTSVRKACSMGGMIRGGMILGIFRKYDLPDASSMALQKIRFRIREYDSGHDFGYDSMKCNMLGVINYVPAISG